MDLNGVPATLDQMKALALTNYGHFTSMQVRDGAVAGWCWEVPLGSALSF